LDGFEKVFAEFRKLVELLFGKSHVSGGGLLVSRSED